MNETRDRKNLITLLLPFSLAAIALVADQVVKAIVVAAVPVGTVGASWLWDFLRIWHVKNLGVAFSLGAGWDQWLRALAFQALPVVLIIGLLIYYFRSKELTSLQRWLVTGIVGGGLGNIVDRVFRPDGVVDFISVKFFGIFGWERWPTFNIADSFIVVCGILLFLTTLVDSWKARGNPAAKPGGQRGGR
jgi:signal peptidase II